jgi:hypothetical protein
LLPIAAKTAETTTHKLSFRELFEDIILKKFPILKNMRGCFFTVAHVKLQI